MNRIWILDILNESNMIRILELKNYKRIESNSYLSIHLHPYIIQCIPIYCADVHDNQTDYIIPINVYTDISLVYVYILPHERSALTMIYMTLSTYI